MTKKGLNELRGEKITLPITKMNGTEQAIKKAVSVGYKDYTESPSHSTSKYHSDILLDPDFWKCLGKAEGWIVEMPSRYSFNDEIAEWEHYWHSFIDHLADGGNIDDFFNNLLK